MGAQTGCNQSRFRLQSPACVTVYIDLSESERKEQPAQRKSTQAAEIPAQHTGAAGPHHLLLEAACCSMHGCTSSLTPTLQHTITSYIYWDQTDARGLECQNSFASIHNFSLSAAARSSTWHQQTIVRQYTHDTHVHVSSMKWPVCPAMQTHHVYLMQACDH